MIFCLSFLHLEVPASEKHCIYGPTHGTFGTIVVLTLRASKFRSQKFYLAIPCHLSLSSRVP